MNLNFDFILASKSDRRVFLLKKLNYKFLVKTAKVEEKSRTFTKNPEEIAQYNANLKALALNDDATVLAADTVVLIDDELIGKPKNRIDALAILSKLNGKQHFVITAVSLAKNKKIIDNTVVKTMVFFNKLDLSIYEKYLDTTNYKDKAGAYAIQESFGLFIDRIEGSFTNVVGLPVRETMSLLKKHSIFPH